MRKSGFGLVAIMGLLAGPAFSQDATPSSAAVEVSAFELPWSDFACRKRENGSPTMCSHLARPSDRT